MDKEKLNITVSGNIITNKDDLIEYISTLEYDFNLDEYLKVLYIRLLYSEYVNRTSLLKCIKQKLDEFINLNESVLDIKYLIDNNDIDDRVITYMDMLLESMPYRLEHNELENQALLDDYINYISKLNSKTDKQTMQINYYYKIKENFFIQNKKLEMRKKNSLGATTIVILLEILAIFLFIFLYSKI